MAASATKTPLSAFTLESFSNVVAAAGFPRYRAKQVLDWYYRRGARRFADMKNLSAPVAEYLESGFVTLSSTLLASHDSGDGASRLDIALEDRLTIETVVIETDRRVTLCLSSQAGCPVGCSFCATGAGGFERNLHPHEIVEQALHAAAGTRRRISNVVFMGMGEPCLNLDAVFDAIRVLNAPYAFNIGARKVTISTLGFPGCIDRIAQFPMEVGLAISLHAPTDQLRRKLIPRTPAPVAEVVAAARGYFEKTGREVTYEYVLLAGVNDSPADAVSLAKLLCGERAFVNLIAYNEVAGLPYRRPSPHKVAGFRRALENKGLNVHVRDSRGRGAGAACGQLRLERISGGAR